MRFFCRRIGLFALLWLAVCLSTACAADGGHWRLDEPKSAELWNFRMATDAWHNAVEGREPTRRGMAELHVSASAQPSLSGLSSLHKKLVKIAPNPGQIYIVDLRQESHGFADGFPVSWYKKRNNANVGMDAEAVEKDEAKRLQELLGEKTRFVPQGDSDKARFKEKTFAPKKTLTEREAAEAAGFHYVRFAATDKVWPDNKEIDNFLKFVSNLPPDAWLHFHCHAGHGRTTTFLSIYDILRNPDVSLEDVVKRHYLQGGTDLLADAEGDKWKAKEKRKRAKMLRLFYRYANELRTKETSLPWSTWLKHEEKAQEQASAGAFPSEPSGELDEAAIASTEWKVPSSYLMPLMETGVRAGQVSILGGAEVSERQMVRFLEKRNPHPKLNCTPTELVRCYYEEAGREGIRPDIALCQAFKETGFFQYGGDVLPEQNNFCGLGALGNKVKGASFPSPRLGARAHIQHLLAYASTNPPSVEIVDPRYGHIAQNRKDIHGQIHTWTGLNGVWAVPGTHYGQDILNLWGQAKAPDGSPESMIQAGMALRKAPESAAAHLALAIAYANGGRSEDALLEYGESLRIAPSAEAYYDRALLHEKLGDREAALADYTDALEREPEFLQGWYNRGLLLLALGRNEEAVSDFRESITLSPQLANAYVGIGIAKLQENAYALAWENFYEAGQINGANAIVRENQKRMMHCLRKAQK